MVYFYFHDLYSSNYLGSQGIIINSAPISHVPTRAAPKSSSVSALRTALVDTKPDIAKTDDKTNMRSSRSKSKGIEDADPSLPSVDEPNFENGITQKRGTTRSDLIGW